MSEWANFAARFRPTLVNGKPVWNPGELDLFEKFMQKSCLYAHWGAPYQDPTYKAIAVMAATSAGFAANVLPIVRQTQAAVRPRSAPSPPL